LAPAYIRCAVVWSDADLLEIQTVVRYQEWGGGERAYVSHDELPAFAAALEALAAGRQTEASLAAGQRDVRWTERSLREYGLARRLAIHVALGAADGDAPGAVGGPTELRITVPVERGQLEPFAAALRRISTDEQGEAVLSLLTSWP
jgi:hypothetical protein